MKGLSAMLRIKNEEQFIKPCIESIIDWFDEVVVCLQNCTDGTEKIVRAFDDPKIKIYHYRFDSLPNGDGYNKQDATSPYSRTYFYNWCLDKCSYDHVCKWDGDMVAMDWLGESIIILIDSGVDYIKFSGLNIVNNNYLGSHQKSATDGVFKVTQQTRYVNGIASEKLTGVKVQKEIIKPAYLDFKWSKPIATATAAWPNDWESMPHFQNIIKRAEPIIKYTGEYPSCITGYL